MFQKKDSADESKIVTCAIVGLGRISWNYHIPAILADKKFSLECVVDPDPRRLEEAAETFGVKHVFRDCRELVEKHPVDLAVIASPTLFHCEQTIGFLEHGIDVFCDKPIAVNTTEAAMMSEAAGRNGRRLMVYQPHRLRSETLTARAIIDSGKLGRIYMIHRSCDSFVRRNDWQAQAKYGGGMLLNYGAHFIDQLLYLGKEKCVDARCIVRTIVSAGDSEDFVTAALTGENGMVYRLNINMAAPIPESPFAIYGTRGSAFWEGNEWRLKYCPVMPDLKLQGALAAEGRQYASEHLEFVEEKVAPEPDQSGTQYRKCYDYFGSGGAPFVPLSETLEVMRIIDLCRQDSSAERQCIVPSAKRARSFDEPARRHEALS